MHGIYGQIASLFFASSYVRKKTLQINGYFMHFTNMVMCGTGCHEVEDSSSLSAQRSPRGERSPNPREQRSPSPREQRSPSPRQEERGGGGGGGGVESSSSDAMVACFGELLIDFVPTIGGLSLAGAPAFKKAPGGAPANVACGIAKLGSTAAFLGKVKNAQLPISLFWFSSLEFIHWVQILESFLYSN